MSRWDDLRVDQERAERWAQQKNKRLAQRYPLFAQAGILDQVVEPASADKFIDSMERARVRHIEQDIRQLHQAAEMRAHVGRIVGTEELARLDERRAIYPPTPEYTADYWRRMLVERQGD